MKKKIIIILSSLLVVSCSTQEEIIDKEINYKQKLEAYDNSSTYTLDMTYKEDYFNHSSFEFDKELMKFSFGLSIASTTKETMTTFIKDLKCKNYYLNDDYNINPTTTSLAYAFIKKETTTTPLVMVGIRGINYKLEWVNNFKFGTSGNHQGYEDYSSRVYNSLSTWLKDNNLDNENTRILISGYSKAAAVTTLLTDKINTAITNNNLNLDIENVYAYSFEAPRSSSITKDIKNLFRIYNSSDFITYFPFESYGLHHLGQEVNIFNKDNLSKISELEPKTIINDFSMREFSLMSEGMSKEAKVQLPINEFFDNIFNVILSSTESFDISTRNKFVSTLEPAFSYLVSTLMQVDISELSSLKDVFESNMLGLVFDLLNKKEGIIYNFLKQVYDELKINYEEDKLKEACAPLENLLYMILDKASDSFLDYLVTFVYNAQYIISMHTPEMTYTLINNY